MKTYYAIRKRMSQDFVSSIHKGRVVNCEKYQLKPGHNCFETESEARTHFDQLKSIPLVRTRDGRKQRLAAYVAPVCI